MSRRAKTTLASVVGVLFLVGAAGGVHAATPKRGGILNIIVGSKIPSYDGHKERTFGMIHPFRPFYSLLIRVNPDNPQSTSDFVCDVCEGAVPTPTNGGKRYAFKIRSGIKFHDGTPMTAQDLLATWNKIVFPPATGGKGGKEVRSSRKAFYQMVEKISAPDDTTLVFDLKYPSAGFIPAVAAPFNFIYSKADLDKHGYTWHEKNVNGTGAFTFVQHQSGAFVEGKKSASYHHKGKDGKALPYIDGYKAISAPKMAVRVNAIRGNRAAIEFRGFPPKTRDDLRKALGDKITVQESNWNCHMGASANVTDKGPKVFQDHRVRQALTLSLNRKSDAGYISQIAVVRTVGGIVFPDHELAMTQQELESLPPFDPDDKKRQAMAKKLLADAGATDLKFKLWNRGVDQPYKHVGTWMIGQWRKVGLQAEQTVVNSSAWFAGQRKGEFDVTIDNNCQSVVNPLIDISKWNSAKISKVNFAGYNDEEVDALYQAMVREGDAAKIRELVRKYEKRIVWDKAYFFPGFWWYKINPHRSYVKGWKIAPSHYLNQHLDRVWIDESS